MFRVLRPINWKVFLLLLGMGVVGVLAGLPLFFEMFEGIGKPTLPFPLPVVVLLSLLQNTLLLSVAIGVGLLVSMRIGLEMPLIEARAAGRPAISLRAAFIPALLCGLAVGGALVLLEILIFLQHLPRELQMMATGSIPLWKRLLAGVLYGGFTEELLMRLFLFSLVAWLLGLIWKAPNGSPSTGAFWTANVIVALLFGLGHLPATAMVTPLTPIIVVRALLLNGVASLVFGHLYWRRGLEAAMVAHMSTHVVIQIPGVLLIRLMLAKP